MSTNTGKFFPAEYKTFAFEEGDLLVSERSAGKFAIKKVLKIDKVTLKEGDSISILGKNLSATVDDYLLVVSTSYGETLFESFEEARAAALSGKWKVLIGHVPGRPFSKEGQVAVGSAPVLEAELVGYRQWKQAFDRGEAGVS